MPKLLTILGARPQFIKAAALTRAIANESDTMWEQLILHTGQHYDDKLSRVFFNTLNLPQPDYRILLESSDRPTRMLEMKENISSIVDDCNPDLILVYGDTDSTLAGAQVAHEKNIYLVHIEAGLRSFDMNMPEELNRIETDKLSNILVAPTKTAVINLENEGIYGAFLTGDIMHDNALHFSNEIESKKTNTALLTLHRPSNVDSISRLKNWMECVSIWSQKKGIKIVFPVHPRTVKSLVIAYGPDWKSALNEMSVHAIDPVGYIELLGFIKSSILVVTDSGGVQKEAYSCGIPSVVVRHNTEWVELVEAGHTVLAPEPKDFFKAAEKQCDKILDVSDSLYGHGNSAEQILAMLSKRLC